MRLAVVLAVAAISACSPASSVTQTPISELAGSSSSDGLFRLTLTIDKPAWAAGEPISGGARLETDGDRGWISGGAIVAFAYTEVGGHRAVQPIYLLDCRPRSLSQQEPVSVPLGKSGVIDPADGFSQQFLHDPQIRLPIGTWDVTATARFYVGTECDGELHILQASVRLQVE